MEDRGRCKMCGAPTRHPLGRYCSYEHERIGQRRVPINIEKGYAKLLRGDPCSYCDQRGGIALDHIDPLEHGGENDETNVTPACKSCNSSKGRKPLLLFLARASA